MHPVNVVFRKELLDGRRDRRAVLSALAFPVLGPLLVYVMMTAVVNLRTDAEKTTVPVVGAVNAPALIQWLREQNVRIVDFDGDPREAIRDKEHELVLVIPDDFQQRYAVARPAIIEIIQDGSRTDAQVSVNRIKALLRQYTGQIAGLRLIARGISPQIINVLSIEDIDVASKQQRAAAALNMIPMYIILAAFVSGMGLAIDSTAGERERKSLEPLLINPVEHFHVVTGKWFAASLFASLGMVLTAVLCILAMVQVPLEEVGLTFSITPIQLTAMILGTFPLAFLATGMQLFLGMFAKSFKDAQSYMGLLVILPIIPSMFTLFNPIATQDWMFAVPMLGQHLLLVDVIGGKTVPVIAYGYSATSCLVAGFGLVLLTARQFKRESIITS